MKRMFAIIAMAALTTSMVGSAAMATEPTSEVVTETTVEQTVVVPEPVAETSEEPATELEPVTETSTEPVVEQPAAEAKPATEDVTATPEETVVAATSVVVTKVTPDLLITCAPDADGGNTFAFGAGGNETVGIVYDPDISTADAFVTAIPKSGYVLDLLPGWVMNGDGSATANATALVTLKCSTTPPVEPTCVASADVDWSFTYDGLRSGTVTAASAKAEQGTKLCDPLAVRPTGWLYVLPASGSPSWPQKLAGYNDVLVDSIGVFSYAAPGPDKCRQFDIYAAFISDGGFDALELPETLNASGKPFEPQFLSEALPNKGPNTWHATTSEGCNTPPPPPVVVPVTGTATFETLTCTVGSMNWADTDTVSDGVWTFKDKNGKEFKTLPGKAYMGEVPEGLAFGDITVKLSDAGKSAVYDVTPWSGVWTTVDLESLDCYTPPPPPVVVPVTGTATFESLTCTVGSKNWATTDAVEDGVWTFTDKNGKEFTTLPGVPFKGGVPEGLAFGNITVTLTQREGEDYNEGDDHEAAVVYDVTPWSGVWSVVEPASLNCFVTLPPVNTTAPVITASKTITVKTWHPASNLPPVLASTGANDNQLLIFGFAGLGSIVVGAALVMLRAARRRVME